MRALGYKDWPETHHSVLHRPSAGGSLKEDWVRGVPLPHLPPLSGKKSSMRGEWRAHWLWAAAASWLFFQGRVSSIPEVSHLIPGLEGGLCLPSSSFPGPWSPEAGLCLLPVLLVSYSCKAPPCVCMSHIVSSTQPPHCPSGSLAMSPVH